MTTRIAPGFLTSAPVQHFAADRFPRHQPAPWFSVHLATGGWSPLQLISGLYTAHVTTFAAGQGVSWHTHRNEETFTWMLDGALAHEDTAGGRGELAPGDFQRMFAGHGIEHRELSVGSVATRFVQIVFLPDAAHGLVAPHYQQLRGADLPARRVGDATERTLLGGDSPMQQHCTARLTATAVDAGGQTTVSLPGPDEDLLLYVTDGVGRLGDSQPLAAYDVVIARPDAGPLAVAATTPLHFLSFYLRPFVPR